MKIKIKDFTINIIIIEDGNDSRLIDKNGNLCFGLYDSMKQTILLQKNTKQRMRTTLLHEITHAYIDIYGFYEQRNFNHEMICDFIGIYSVEIVKKCNYILDKYCKK